MKKGWAVILFLVFSLTLSLIYLKEATSLFPKAEKREANIIVNPSVIQGPLIPFWRALAQGGEGKYPFRNVLSEIAALNPQYIRIDHIYDFYNVVKKEDKQLVFNWTELDEIVSQILEVNALPFFSLSYMPPAIAKNGDIVNPPENWQDWMRLVKETVQHYSGKDQKNLINVIYEVWNEPDLFGKWKIGGEKDYRLLYKYAVWGANQTKNTNPFKIGGPATTLPYKNWVGKFLDFTVENNLRIDFYSWHRYSSFPGKFLEDINAIDNWLFKNSGLFLEKYLTEWAPSSEISPLNSSDFSGAHLVATARQLLQRVDLAFVFEITGSWGILDQKNEKQFAKNPRYYGLEFLNKMEGTRIGLEGENDWITGFATIKGSKIRIILANLDSENRYFEVVPLTVINLENGSYSYQELFMRGAKKSSTEIVTHNIFRKKIPLTPNNIVLVEIEKI